MELYTTSQARGNFFKIIEDVNKYHSPVYVVGKKNKAVILSEEDYRSILETLYITSIPGMEKAILDAAKEPIESCKTEIEWE